MQDEDRLPVVQLKQDDEKAAAEAEDPADVEEAQDRSPWAIAGRWAEAITSHGDFENFIMVIIAGTVVTLALQDPLLGDMEGRNLYLYWLSECRMRQGWQAISLSIASNYGIMCT